MRYRQSGSKTNVLFFLPLYPEYSRVETHPTSDHAGAISCCMQSTFIFMLLKKFLYASQLLVPILLGSGRCAPGAWWLFQSSYPHKLGFTPMHRDKASKHF